MKFFWKLFLAAKGWDTTVTFPFWHLKKSIFIVAPHTSNWDFMIGLAYRNYLGLNHVQYLGKKELFRPPYGFLFRWIGGIPVDRRSSHNLVEDVVRIFKERDRLSIALAPEGTRKKVDKLRTGFYYIALNAMVPIIMVGLDYKNKTLPFGLMTPSGDFEKDMEVIYGFYRTIEGKNPELGLMHK
jgi:1-acyl-sn-glycerol-3-phosphate acyltransferase